MAENLIDEIKRRQLELLRHQRLYHADDAPEISDETYDQLARELEGLEARLEPTHPLKRQSPLGKALLFQPLDHVEIGREIAGLAQNGLAARAHFKRRGNQLEQVHTGGIAGNDLMR